MSEVPPTSNQEQSPRPNVMSLVPVQPNQTSDSSPNSGNQPSSNSSAPSNMSVGRTVAHQSRARQPQILLDVLDMTTSITSDNTPLESHPRPISPERKEFLEKALDALVVDFVPEIQKRVDILKEIHTEPENVVDANLSKYEQTFEQLIDFMYEIDFAQAFYQINGISVITPLLKSKHASFRKYSAAIIVECCKNNPYCQKLSLTDEIFGSLMEMASSDPNKEAMFNAIAAVSAITRDNPAGISQFNKYNGIQMVEKALNSGNEKIVNKTIFLVMALCDTDETIKKNLTDSGVIITLITLLRLSDYLVKEYILRALLSVTKDNLTAQKTCCDNDLEAYLNTLKMNTEPEYEDMVECAESLRQQINSCKTATGGVS